MMSSKYPSYGNIKIENINIRTLVNLSTETINHILTLNNINVGSNELINKLVLLKVINYYLPAQDKNLLYQKDFDDYFILYGGNIDLILPKIKKINLEYSYSIGTFSYLSITESAQLYLNYWNIEELYESAALLNLDLYSNPDELYDQIVKVLPTYTYLKNNMIELSGISESNKNEILDYVNYKYKQINEKLRSSPNLKYELNEVIESSPPLENDIIVFRVIDGLKFPMNGIFKSYGMLSTTFNYHTIIKNADDIKRLLKIKRQYMFPVMKLN